MRRSPVLCAALLAASWLNPTPCHAQFDPNRYRPDVLFGTDGHVLQPLGSAVGQDFAAQWSDRNARLNPVGVNATGWVFGGNIIFNGDLLFRLEQRLISDQGAVSVSSRRELAAFRRLGGVVGAPDGTAGAFVSWLAGRPSNSVVTQFRYNAQEGYSGCNASSFFSTDLGTAGSGDDEVRAVTRGPNGTAYAVGTLDAGGGEWRAFIARFAGDCTLDAGFNGSGLRVVDAFRNVFVPARRVRFNGVRVDAAGRPVAVGGVQYSTSGVAEGDCVIARFNSNGGLDTSFDGDGIQLYRPSGVSATAQRCDFTDIDFDSSQRLVLLAEVEDAVSQPPSGQRNPGDVAAVRFAPGGGFDADFGVYFRAPQGRTGAGLLVLDNGDILYAYNDASLSSNTASLINLFARDPVGGAIRWDTNLVAPTSGLGGSGMASDLLELPGSGFLLAGFSGSGRFNHTTAWLRRYTFGLRYRLSVNVLGSGAGRISSTPAGIDCGNGAFECSMVVDVGQSVTLTATPTAGSLFSGWSPGSCGSAGSCVYQVNANTTVTATFGANTLSVLRQGGGNGGVTSNPAGINCGSTCSADFSLGSVVTLTAAPAAGSIFAGWQSAAAACGSNPTCAINMTSPRSAVAVFEPATQNVAVSITGVGQVGSTPAGINCPGTCAAPFGTGSTVTLQASDPPLSAFRFDAWGGDGAVCGTNPHCALSVNAARIVTATFVRRRITVSVSALGGGVVSTIPAGIANCAGTCSAQFDAGATVTLVANAGGGQTFAGWSGDAVVCGNNIQCALSPLGDIASTATFGTAVDPIFANGFEP